MSKEKDRPDPDGTEMVDLGDADVSAVDIPPSSRGALHERSLPPPLPAEVRASSPPMNELARAPSNAPPPPIARVSVVPSAAARSNRFYLMIVVAVLAIGIIGGIAVAMGTRGEKKPTVTVVPGAAPTASAAGAGSVMTLPTIDMNDDEDGGK